MNKILLLTICQLLFFVAFSQNTPESKYGWKLGVQTYTFKEFTFFEALDKIDSVGVKNIESYRNMVIGGGIEGKMDFNMSAETRNQIKKWLSDRNMKFTGYGVVNLKSEGAWRKLFEFGKEMGIETFTAEPEEKYLPLISELCDQYGINVAIHNHAYPSYYWYPQNILKAIEGLSKRIGACADIGHWVRSGLNPVACLQQLGNRVLWLHMKDISSYGEQGHSVVWGQGVIDFPAIVEQLKASGFTGQLSAEYEYKWEHNTVDVQRSVQYFRSLLN
ncbi:MAG: sugar phosphate isomerase/epimerase [Chitinophagaceae bacterium]|nr:sugar phosphate isomerase/epimerase [Chitinophagaceae bacterium]